MASDASAGKKRLPDRVLDFIETSGNLLPDPAMMFPYSMVILVLWTIFLLLFWMLGIPLGVASSYVYPS